MIIIRWNKKSFLKSISIPSLSILISFWICFIVLLLIGGIICNWYCFNNDFFNWCIDYDCLNWCIVFCLDSHINLSSLCLWCRILLHMLLWIRQQSGSFFLELLGSCLYLLSRSIIMRDHGLDLVLGNLQELLSLERCHNLGLGGGCHLVWSLCAKHLHCLIGSSAFRISLSCIEQSSDCC